MNPWRDPITPCGEYQFKMTPKRNSMSLSDKLSISENIFYIWSPSEKPKQTLIRKWIFLRVHVSTVCHTLFTLHIKIYKSPALEIACVFQLPLKLLWQSVPSPVINDKLTIMTV